MNQKQKTKQRGIAFTYVLAAAGALAAIVVASSGLMSSLIKPSAEITIKTVNGAAASQSIVAISRSVTNDSDSYPLPPAGVGASGDGYDIPQVTGAALVDAWGTKFRYCAWDYGVNKNAGLLAGDTYPAASAILYAVISAGQDKAFGTTCAALKTGSVSGDDVAGWRTLNDYKRDGVGNPALMEAVDCESAAAPATDVLGAASGCATSTSRLDLIDTSTVKDGQQLLVRKSGKIMIRAGTNWYQAISGSGNYPAPTAFNFVDKSDQVCGAAVDSAPVQINGIVVGTPITIANGSYATSIDNVTYSAWTTSPSTIGPGTWVKLRATTAPSTDFATTSVVLNIAGTEKIWNVSNAQCKCTLPWGGTINSGQSTTAYSTSSVPFGNTCTSETRTCTGTTLSGTYQYGSCTVQAGATCNLPWGGTLSSGQSVTAYSTNSVAYGSSCSSYSQTRTCTNGTLSGSYSYGSCSTASPSGCYAPWGSYISHGGSVTAYSTTSVPSGSSCSWYSQTRTCSNGSLSGSYSYNSCSVAAPTYSWTKVQTDWWDSPGNGTTGTCPSGSCTAGSASRSCVVCTYMGHAAGPYSCKTEWYECR